MADMIDLRSDFLSRPTEEMVAAMMEATGARPVFGLRDDPYQQALEARAAGMLGQDDALFCPTCTMANQIALHVYCRQGDAFVIDAAGHMINSESGAPAALTGAMAKMVANPPGRMDPTAVAEAIRAADAQRSRTRLIVMENTHVLSGGTVLPEADMAGIATLGRERGIPVHLDGSRIFNAAIALGVPGRQLGAHADTVSLSLNKALGAPLGAILAGSKDVIEEAVRIRQMFGGGWRPTSIPAAAALVALDHMVDRLADDHANARRLADGLSGCPGIAVDGAQVQSNIVLARLSDPDRHSLETVIAGLAEAGVQVIAFGPNVMRLVLYHNITATDVDRTVEIFGEVMTA